MHEKCRCPCSERVVLSKQVMCRPEIDSCPSKDGMRCLCEVCEARRQEFAVEYDMAV